MAELVDLSRAKDSNRIIFVVLLCHFFKCFYRTWNAVIYA